MLGALSRLAVRGAVRRVSAAAALATTLDPRHRHHRRGSDAGERLGACTDCRRLWRDIARPRSTRRGSRNACSADISGDAPALKSTPATNSALTRPRAASIDMCDQLVSVPRNQLNRLRGLSRTGQAREAQRRTRSVSTSCNPILAARVRRTVTRGEGACRCDRSASSANQPGYDAASNHLSFSTICDRAVKQAAPAGVRRGRHFFYLYLGSRKSHRRHEV